MAPLLPLAVALLVATASTGAAPPQGHTAPVAAGARSARSAADPHRLERSVRPLQYHLALEPNLDRETFEGTVAIEVAAEEAVDSVTLHAVGLDFDAVSVTRAANDAAVFESAQFLAAYEQVQLLLREDLVPNEKYTIRIQYHGALRHDMYGFYVSTYYQDGPRKLAATQFQATHARKAFPCFDEPSFKARFQISVTAPPGYLALSNMPEKDRQTLSSNSVQYNFHNSVKMSSYLVAFIVSDFVDHADKDNGNPGEVTFKTWSRPGVSERTAYSLEVSRPMLKVLEGYTGIPYIDDEQDPPIDKVDQVALPDFSAGAMENWGLITYRETALLYDYDNGPATSRRSVAVTIAHELLHMWFGNLVTTHWWGATWLNEGFARYFQYYVTDKVEAADWRMWDQFVVDQHQMVFALDSVQTANALTHQVSTPAEASASFGTITYSKGGSILRMISFLIQPDNFQKALQNYLQKHKYENVNPQDLFDQLTPFAGNANLEKETFEEFLKSWTEQPGYPLVTVIRDYGANTATVSQRRFLFKGTSTEQYIVPLTWAAEGDSFEFSTPTVYLEKSSPLVGINMPPEDKWVIFNVQETGYYRVNYDEKNWNLISKYLNDHANPIDDIHYLNRAQLLDDSFNLARAGYLEYKTTLGLADYLSRETDYVPWAAAYSAFSYLNRMLVNHPKYPVFQRYISQLLDKAYQQIEITFLSNSAPERHDEKLLMNRITSLACIAELESCVGHVHRRLLFYISSSESVHQDQRSVVYCYGIRHSPDFFWTSLWQMYQSSTDDVERGLIIAGLACSGFQSRLAQLLELTIAGEDIRKQDASSVFSAVYSNPLGVDVALDFLNENFEDVSQYFGSISNILSGIAGRMTTSEQREKLQEFVTKFKDELGSTGDAALAVVDDNLQWLSTHAEEIFRILEDKELQMYRLPQSVIPNHYTIFIDAALEHVSFTGDISILVTAMEATEVIVLHAEGVSGQNIVVKAVDDDNNLYESDSFDVTHQLMKIHLTRPLIKGKVYEISMFFAGPLRRDMYGFYLSSYTNEKGEQIQLAATQFQPTYARRAFPCFDEPNFKATFSLTVRAPEYYHVLSNMPSIETVRRDGSHRETSFQTTPRMSTYLLAFVVSDFVEWEDRLSPNDVLFRTWARRNAIEWAHYSIQVSRPLLETLETLTGIEYIDRTLEHPFDKVDQVAVPDFSAGAMENWGLVTYRELMLLFNDGTASARKGIATVITHELTHMWFGNLVTTHWWDATWLNEGFAQYFQFYATSLVKPAWRLMEQFVVDHHQAVMGADALPTSAALTSPAYTPAQVSARFGSITYSKGASILRMISAIMGENKFLEALHEYLVENRYSTTIPEDLFQHLVEKSTDSNLGKNAFENLLRSWTEQPGYPALKIDRNYEEGSATISQARFLLKRQTSPDPTLYYVPLTWVGPGGDFSATAPKAYLAQEQTRTVTGMPGPQQWVIFNVQETGFYRVNYDDTNWRLLSAHLQDPSQPLDGVHVLNRAQLLDDAFNLARAGQLDYAVAFDLADYLQRETDFIPWASALAAFSYLQRMLVHNDRYPVFEAYVRSLLEERYEHFGFRDRDGHIDKLFLNRVSAWACSLQHPPCTRAARNALDGFLQGEEVPADLRSVVYCYGVRQSPKESWYELLEKYKNSLDHAERALLMAGLACSYDEDLLNELLGYSIQGTFIRKQDAASVFSSVYGNSVGVEVALNFLDEHFDQVEEYYGSMGAINNIVVGIAGRLTTQEQRDKMRSFVEKHSESLGNTADAALATVDENLEWLEDRQEIILETLEEKLTSEPSTTQTPTEPSTTQSPLEPSTTQSPLEPSTTQSPLEPSTTQSPSEPSMTASPTEPSTTASPTQPSTTASPTEPSTTQSPSEPSTTESPTEPSTTQSPTEPSTPSTTTDVAGSLRATTLAVLALVMAVMIL